jgi:hypothetical protein
MKNLIANICLTLAVLLGSVGMSASADFQRGFTAFGAGYFTNILHN